MGARLTAFENRASVDMEIRVFVPPDRPDHYRMIIRVKPGEVKKVLTMKLCNWDEYFTSPIDDHIFLMVFMDGVYTGVTLLPFEVKNYAKILGYYAGDCRVILKGVKYTLASFFRFNCCNFAIGKKFKGLQKGKYYSSVKECSQLIFPVFHSATGDALLLYCHLCDDLLRRFLSSENGSSKLMIRS